MLAKKFVSLPTQLVLPLQRSFTVASSLRKRAPALADILPNNGADFDANQASFRESLRQRVQQNKGTATSLKDQNIGSTGSHAGGVGVLGSLSTHDPKDEITRQQSTEHDESKVGGSSSKLSNLIYGTDEGRQMDQVMERSFSQVLARGKYVHSIVFHTVKPDKVDEYVKLVGSWYPRVAGTEGNHVHLVGSWRTEVGDCDTFVHIWEYQGYRGYHASLNSIASHPEFPAFNKELRSLITSKHTSLMQEFSFWPTTSPRKLGGIFELRSYTLHPGNLLEWETHWRKGLAARREVMEGVGAWFVQIGDLNTVHHLWQFANLEERKSRREKSWGVEGWGDTVHKTVPLIESMKSSILISMPWSPVA